MVTWRVFVCDMQRIIGADIDSTLIRHEYNISFKLHTKFVVFWFVNIMYHGEIMWSIQSKWNNL